MTLQKPSSAKGTGSGTAWKDLPRRLLTVGVGVPCIVAVLRNSVTSFLFFQGAHVICLWEWSRLVPPAAEESKSGDSSAKFKMGEIIEDRKCEGVGADDDHDGDFIVVDDRNEEISMGAGNKDHNKNKTRSEGVSQAKHEPCRKESGEDTTTPAGGKRQHREETNDNLDSLSSLSIVTLVLFSVLSVILTMIPSKHLLPSFMIASVALRLVRHFPDDDDVDLRSNISAVADHCQFGLVFITIAFHYMLRISQFGGPSHIGFLLFVVWMADTGALVAGRTMKKRREKTSKNATTNLGNSSGAEPSSDDNTSRKVIYALRFLRSVSPGKTAPGLVGALLTGPVAAAMWPGSLPPFGAEESPSDVCPSHYDSCPRSWHFHPMVLRCLLGLLLAAVGILGDLTESSVKRAAQMKDSGRLLPGHGGILDRFDSLFVASMVYYHFVFSA